MMISAATCLALSGLGARASGWPSARLLLTLNVNLVSSEVLALETMPDPFDGAGSYYVVAHEMTTGEPKAAKHDSIYAVIDGRHDKREPALTMLAAGGLEIESIQDLVAVRLPGGTLAEVAP